MSRTTYVVSIASFVADPVSIDQDTGRQIDWDNVDAGTADANGNKHLPAGTVMAQLASGMICPRLTVPAAETATCILLTNATENEPHAALSGYGTLVGGVIYQNILPDAAEGAFATWQGELNAVGVGHFVWRDWSDNSSV